VDGGPELTNTLRARDPRILPIRRGKLSSFNENRGIALLMHGTGAVRFHEPSN